MTRRLHYALIVLLLFSFVLPVSFGLNVVNSKEWTDVYSVMLYSSMNNEQSVFVKSESLNALTRVIPTNTQIVLYNSPSGFISNLGGQLGTAGYTVTNEVQSSEFYSELNPNSGKYILVSSDNHRIVPSLAPYAKLTNSWVLFVDDETVSDITNLLTQSDSVIAVGKFRRDVLDAITPLVDETIDTGNAFTDSVEIAKKFPAVDSVVITDAKALESEYFSTTNPVLITGTTRLPDETYDYLVSSKVKSVILVGNQLAVIGEDIRTKSEKTISVFIKFGQSDARNVGSILALSFFTLPVDEPSLAVDSVIFNPSSQDVTVIFENTGNVGLYTLSTMQLKVNEQNLASSSDAQAVYLGAGERLPVNYQIEKSSNFEELFSTENLVVDLFTSYGILPTSLDNFLTQNDKFAPPYRSEVQVSEFESDTSELTLVQAEYFKSYKRVGVTVQNTGDTLAYYTVRILDLTVNGLTQNLVKQETRALGVGESRISYIPVELDSIDLEENQVFDVSITYGSSQDLLLKNERVELPFIVNSSINSTYLFIGIGVLVLLVLIAGIVIFMRR